MNPKNKAAIEAAIRENKKMTPAEKEKRKKEIKARAGKVYDISLDYHLTHAAFGSDDLLIRDLKETYKEKYKKIKNAVSAAVLKKDDAKVELLENRKRSLDMEVESRKRYILIRYVDMRDGSGGRVLGHDKKFIIVLPNKLKENVKDEKGELVPGVVKKIREKMAHETGHIVLHTSLIPVDISGDQLGTSYLDPLDWEAEVFARELLRLYSKKDHLIKEKEAS
jgi:hypothetical protein